MKKILGISAGFHDAAASIVDRDGNIVFAAHSERYSKTKNDAGLHADLLAECSGHDVDTVAFYERPWMHNLQQWYSGQQKYGPWTTQQAIKKHLAAWYQPTAHRVSYAHHLSHAAAGFQTSPFESAAVVVIDAIGELDTISIYRAWYEARSGRARYQRLWRQTYPHSVGLFYSAITKAVGLKPMEEEYITMGMAAYGSDLGCAWIRDEMIQDMHTARFKRNLHAGFDELDFLDITPEDLAASAGASLTKTVSYFTTVAAETATLSAGANGQVKVFCMAGTGGDMTITVANAGWKTSGNGTITFDTIGDSATMLYINNKWYCIGNNGAAFA
jgi:carbamoyltransferase